ncbi:hypothetical protein ACLOJK_011023 [Asimina triloba]
MNRNMYLIRSPGQDGAFVKEAENGDERLVIGDDLEVSPVSLPELLSRLHKPNELGFGIEGSTLLEERGEDVGCRCSGASTASTHLICG